MQNFPAKTKRNVISKRTILITITEFVINMAVIQIRLSNIPVEQHCSRIWDSFPVHWIHLCVLDSLINILYSYKMCIVSRQVGVYLFAKSTPIILLELKSSIPNLCKTYSIK